MYRMYDDDGALLYVGCSVQWPTRLDEHAAAKHWWENVANVRVEHFADWPDALRAEALALANEGPLHNIAGNKNLRAARALNEAAWQKQRDDEEAGRRARGVYEAWAHCTNCILDTRVEIPRGTPIDEADCPQCGCALRAGHRNFPARQSAHYQEA